MLGDAGDAGTFRGHPASTAFDGPPLIELPLGHLRNYALECDPRLEERPEGRCSAPKWVDGPTLEDGLRALRESVEHARTIRVELDDDYLNWIAVIEARADNQSGRDKSHVWRAERAFRDAVATGRPVSRRT